MISDWDTKKKYEFIFFLFVLRQEDDVAWVFLLQRRLFSAAVQGRLLRHIGTVGIFINRTFLSVHYNKNRKVHLYIVKRTNTIADDYRS